MPASRSRWGRWFLNTGAFAVFLAAALEAWRWVRQVPDADLHQAAAYVRSQYQKEDVIWAEPWYFIGPQRLLGDLTLRSGRNFSPQLLQNYPRVHVLSLRSVWPYHSMVASDNFGVLEQLRSFGGAQVATYRRPEWDEVIWDLGERIRDAGVRAAYGDGPVVCDQWQDGRYVCPRNSDWNYVGPVTLAIDDQARRCVWMHPLANNEELEITVPTLAGGADYYLSGGFSLSDYARDHASSPLYFSISDEERLRYSAIIQPRDPWHYFRIANKEASSFHLKVRTAHNGAAHFCVDFKLVRARQ